MAGSRTNRRRFSNRLECEHLCYAPAGADGPCLRCGMAMLWDRDGWTVITPGFYRKRRLGLDDYLDAPSPKGEEPIDGYYEAVSLQPSYIELDAYEGLIAWPQKSTLAN